MYYATEDPFQVCSKRYKRPIAVYNRKGKNVVLATSNTGRPIALSVETFAARVYLGLPPDRGIWTGVRIDSDLPIARNNIRWVPQQAVKGGRSHWRPLPEHATTTVYDVATFPGYTVRTHPFAVYLDGVMIDPTPISRNSRKLPLYSLRNPHGGTSALSEWTVAALAFLGQRPTDKARYGMLIDLERDVQPGNLKWADRETFYSWLSRWRGTTEHTRYLIYQEYWHGKKQLSLTELAKKHSVSHAAAAHAIKGISPSERVAEGKRRNRQRQNAPG